MTAAFLQSKVPEGDNINVTVPRGFTCKGKLLKLRKTLYGLRQSPRGFWRYLTENLYKCKLNQLDFDTYIFIGERVICIVYSDETFFVKG